MIEPAPAAAAAHRMPNHPGGWMKEPFATAVEMTLLPLLKPASPQSSSLLNLFASGDTVAAL